MKKTILLLLTIILPLLANAQEKSDADSTIAVIAYFCKNDTIKYSDYTAKIKSDTLDATVKCAYEDNYMVVVKDSTSEGYILEFTPTDFSIVNETPTFEDRVAEIAHNAMKGISVLISTNEYGEVKQVLNWQELRDAMRKATKSIVAELKTMKLDSVFNVETMAEAINAPYEKEESLREAYVEALFSLHGQELKVGEHELENELLGVPATTTIVVQYDEEDEENNVYEGDYTIATQTIADVPFGDAARLGLEAMKEVLQDNISEQLDNASKTLTKLNEEGSISVTQTEVLSFFYNGWPKKHTTTTELKTEDGRNSVEVHQIEWTAFATH